MKKGFTLIELMIVVAIIAIIAAIAIPNLLNARRSANERAAMATIKNFHSAATDFSNSMEGQYYWDATIVNGADGSFTNLGVATAATTTYFVHQDTKSGYSFAFDSNDDNGGAAVLASHTANKIVYSAKPSTWSAGHVVFFIDEAGTIYSSGTTLIEDNVAAALVADFDEAGIARCTMTDVVFEAK